MTKEEILRKHLQENEHHSDKIPDMFTRFLIYDAMEEYTQQQLKILNLPYVSVPKGTICPDCNGKGEITTSHEFKHCKRCNGSGQTAR